MPKTTPKYIRVNGQVYRLAEPPMDDLTIVKNDLAQAIRRVLGDRNYTPTKFPKLNQRIKDFVALILDDAQAATSPSKPAPVTLPDAPKWD